MTWRWQDFLKSVNGTSLDALVSDGVGKCRYQIALMAGADFCSENQTAKVGCASLLSLSNFQAQKETLRSSSQP
jgi:hypothetical protein